MTKSTFILATSILAFVVLVGCGSLAEDSMIGSSGDGGAGGGGGNGPGADAGVGMGDAGGGAYDSGAAADSGGGQQDGGGVADAGMSDGGPAFDAARGPACLDTLDCAYGEVCRGGKCVNPSWDAGTSPDTGSTDAGSSDAGTASDADADSGASDGGTTEDAGSVDAGTTLDGGSSCTDRCPNEVQGESVCDGPDEARTCGPSREPGCYSWSAPTTCESGAGCSYGKCVQCSFSLAQDGEACDAVSKPCDCGLECLGLPGRPEAHACHVGCSFFDSCAPQQGCVGDVLSDKACMSSVLAEGVVSCRSYPDGTSPEPSDPPGIASIRFSLSGRSYSFAYCLGDVERGGGPGGAIWTVTLADYTDAAAGVEYRYVLGISGASHSVGMHEVSAAGPLWADIYMLTTDVNGTVVRVTWVGYAAQGALDLRTIGDGAAVETSGVLLPTVHYEANEVVCDNADPDPLRRCP